jgi:hypothetical protein
MLSLVLVVNARLSTMGTDAAGQSHSIVCMPTTSSSCVMVALHSTSTMAVAYALRTTS